VVSEILGHLLCFGERVLGFGNVDEMERERLPNATTESIQPLKAARRISLTKMDCNTRPMNFWSC
jgi:hypothetical protein